MRLFKTRTLAATACNLGRVKILDQVVKPSRHVRVGEVLTAVAGDLTRTIRVLKPIERRVSAAEARLCVEDLTPPEEYARVEMMRKAMAGFQPRPMGMGRPTKKDRRAWTRLEDSITENPPGSDD